MLAYMARIVSSVEFPAWEVGLGRAERSALKSAVVCPMFNCALFRSLSQKLRRIALFPSSCEFGMVHPIVATSSSCPRYTLRLCIKTGLATYGKLARHKQTYRQEPKLKPDPRRLSFNVSPPPPQLWMLHSSSGSLY